MASTPEMQEEMRKLIDAARSAVADLQAAACGDLDRPVAMRPRRRAERDESIERHVARRHESHQQPVPGRHRSRQARAGGAPTGGGHGDASTTP